MSDSKKTDLPDLPEKIEPRATEFKEESLAPIRPVEDSTTTALADALASSFKIIQGLMVGLVVIFLGSGFLISEVTSLDRVAWFWIGAGKGIIKND